MKNLYYLILKVFFLVVSSWGLNNAFGQSVTVPTQRYDNTRLGWNNKELILNTNNVNSNTFGLVFSRPVDDQIYAQPLIVSNLLINGFPHNVVYVATVNNTVYAFDADDPTQNTPLWSINLTPSGSRPVKSSDFNGAPLCPTGYFDFSGNIGIVGTPVIDTLSFTIYLVSRDFNSNTNQFEQFLHAMDIRTGSEKTGSPVSISATYKGSGDGNSNNVIP
ncbi:MAG TPA: PQQ-binding-like beta-propeller repeat protein, partial [Bacteroidales bacterium]